MGSDELKLRSCPKRYFFDTHRVKDPEETLEQVRRVARVVGVTRVTDITGLDRVGIPVVSCIRPAAADGAVSVYTGKGATRTQAEVSALMEAVERYSAEFKEEDGNRVVRGSYSQLKGRLNLVDPRELILPAGLRWSEGSVLRWVKGWDLMENEEVYVPVSAVYHPYSPNGDLHLFKTTTNGLASGNTLEEAVFHGLMEVIERDAWSIVEATRQVCPDLSVDGCRTPLVHQLLERFRSAGIEVSLKLLPTDTGIPIVAAVADDVLLKDPALLTIGFGAHLNPEVAVVRALTEVAQSRLTQIHGVREDTYRAQFLRMLGYERVKRLNRHWFTPSGETVDVGFLPRLDTLDILDDIKVALDRLRQASISRVVVVDLSRSEVQIPAVRVVVPGLEVYGLDSDRVGWRIRSVLKSGVPRRCGVSLR